MATLFTVGVEVQTSAAQQAIARLERAFDSFARTSQTAQGASEKLSRELDGATQEINQFAGEMEVAAKKQQDFERGSLAVAAAMGGLAIKAKQYLNAVVGVGQATQQAIAANSTLAKDAQGLDKAFRELTKELNYSTNSLELNQAAYDVLSAGVSETADVLNVMKAGVAGAKGGFSDLATMTDAVTTIMNAYGKSSSEAQKIVDMMIVTQNDGKIVAGQYGQQIGVVASGAASAGVKLEELNAAISVATVAGVQTSSTFSGLRQAISSIVSPSEQAKKLAKELGIEFSQAGLQQKGFAGVLKDVAEATKGNAEQITKLFGSVEAKAVIDPILNDLGRYNQFLENQTRTAGAATDAQQKLAGGLNQASAAFANVKKEVDRDIFAVIEPAVTALTNATTGLAQAFVSLPEPIQKVAIGIGLVGAAVITTTAAVMAFKALGITTAVVMGSLSTAMGIVLSPIGLLAIAAGGVYLAFQQMMEASESLRKVMETALPRIGKVAEQIFGGIGSAVDRLTGKYQDHESKAEGVFKRMGDWFAKFFEETIAGWERLGRAMDDYMLDQERRTGVGGIKGLSMTEVERNIMAGNLGDGRNTRKILQDEMKRLNSEIAAMEQEAQRFRNSGMGIPNIKLEEDIKKKINQFNELRNAYNRVGIAVNAYNQKQAEGTKPEAQAQAQQAIAAGMEKQAQALESQVPKQRQLADLEITRMQQRLDLERAYGQISQEEILRREAAIRLRRNELSLATLAVEKAEQEQRIKNGENVQRRDFGTEEQRIREDSAFTQQKLVADVTRAQRELQQRESEQRMRAEQDMFNLRRENEVRLYQLQMDNYQFLRDRQLRGRNETEQSVLDMVRNIDNYIAQASMERINYETQRGQKNQQIALLRQQQDSIYASYGQSATPEIVMQYEQLGQQGKMLMESIRLMDINEGQRIQNVEAQVAAMRYDLNELFVDRIGKTITRLGEENTTLAMERKVLAMPEGARVAGMAGLAYEEIYSRPKAQLESARDTAIQQGDMQKAAIFEQQLKRLNALFDENLLQDLEAKLLANETEKAVNQRVTEVARFNDSIASTQSAERDRTKQLGDQLQLLQLQGDEKTRFMASLKAQEIIQTRVAELTKQMEGAEVGSSYYLYMQGLIKNVEVLAPKLTQFFYEQATAQNELVKQTELFNEQLRMTQAIADGMGDSFSSAFGEFVMGTKSAQEAFAGMMGSMANVFMQEFQRMVSQKAAAGLLGLIGNLFGGGLGNMFGGLFGGGGGSAIANAPQASLSGIGAFGFGGGAGSSAFGVDNVAGFGQPLGMPAFAAFADGGIVTKPMMGLVGEAGREAIIPLDKMNGMGNNVSMTVNVYNDGSVSTDQQSSSQLGKELESAVVAVLQKQKRPGGLLASVR